MTPEERIIIALDTPERDQALRWVDQFSPYVRRFKVGLELVNSVGFGLFDDLREFEVFYDAKFHDIPTTVAGAARGAARRGVWMYNVHCPGGIEMMEAARSASHDAAAETGRRPPLVIGVTVLSSLDSTVLRDQLGISESAEGYAVRMAKLAHAAGLDGVVAGGGEVAAIREACGAEFLIMTPGIRPAGAALDDQRRILTPAEAIRRGSTFLGIGRPVTRAADPVTALRAILDEVAAAD